MRRDELPTRVLLVPVFPLLSISVAFQDRPTLTAIGTVTALVYAALQETATGLRSTVTELTRRCWPSSASPPAVRELLRQFESRTDYLLRSTPALTSSPVFGMKNARRDAHGHHRRRAHGGCRRGDLHTTAWLSCSTRFPLTIKPPTAWRCAGRSGMDTVTSVPGDVERTSNCPPDASTLARIDAIPI